MAGFHDSLTTELYDQSGFHDSLTTELYDQSGFHDALTTELNKSGFHDSLTTELYDRDPSGTTGTSVVCPYIVSTEMFQGTQNLYLYDNR